MPTYEYRCDSCGTVVEAVQGFHDAPLTTCPQCQGALRKLFGNVGVVFKGSGFYRNDARAEQKKGSGSSGTAPKKDADSSTPAASESTAKPASTADSGSGSKSGSSTGGDTTTSA